MISDILHVLGLCEQCIYACDIMSQTGEFIAYSLEGYGIVLESSTPLFSQVWLLLSIANSKKKWLVGFLLLVTRSKTNQTTQASPQHATEDTLPATESQLEAFSATSPGESAKDGEKVEAKAAVPTSPVSSLPSSASKMNEDVVCLIWMSLDVYNLRIEMASHYKLDSSNFTFNAICGKVGLDHWNGS